MDSGAWIINFLTLLIIRHFAQFFISVEKKCYAKLPLIKLMIAEIAEIKKA